MSQTKHVFKKVIRKQILLKYLLYLPKDYNARSNVQWPMLLFLHGMGERGDNLELVKKHGIAKIVEERMDFPFVVISPQCRSGSTWGMELDTLYELVKGAIETYNVDEKRVYLTGLSMGGYGAWLLAEAYPHLFAAVVPICGGTTLNIGFPERIGVLKDIPIWVFHGAKDRVVPLENSRQLVDVLKKHNGNVKFTVYPNAGHDSWTKTYKNPRLYKWLLKQKRL